MTKEELAALLNQRKLADEITEYEELEAKTDGLVIVFVGEDDGVSIRGAIYAQVASWDKHSFRVDKEGARPEVNPKTKLTPEAAAEQERRNALPFITLTNRWQNDTTCWAVEAAIPHAPFETRKNQTPFCRGFVFEANAIAAPKHAPCILPAEPVPTIIPAKKPTPATTAATLA